MKNLKNYQSSTNQKLAKLKNTKIKKPVFMRKKQSFKQLRQGKKMNFKINKFKYKNKSESKIKSGSYIKLIGGKLKKSNYFQGTIKKNNLKFY